MKIRKFFFPILLASVFVGLQACTDTHDKGETCKVFVITATNIYNLRQVGTPKPEVLNLVKKIMPPELENKHSKLVKEMVEDAYTYPVVAEPMEKQKNLERFTATQSQKCQKEV